MSKCKKCGIENAGDFKFFVCQKCGYVNEGDLNKIYIDSPKEILKLFGEK